MGHSKGLLALVVGYLNTNLHKIQMPRGFPGKACWSFDFSDTLPFLKKNC